MGRELNVSGDESLSEVEVRIVEVVDRPRRPDRGLPVRDINRDPAVYDAALSA